MKGTKSFIFQLALLLTIGGILVIISGYSLGTSVLEQSQQEMSELQADVYSLSLAGLNVFREEAPLMVGQIFAFLVPIIGIFAWLRIKKVSIGNKDKDKILVSSKFISTIIAISILTLLGGFIGVSSAYKGSAEIEQKTLLKMLELKDILVCFLKGAIFGLILSFIGIFQIKQILRRQGAVPVILITVVTIIFGYIGVMLSDIATTSLFYYLNI